MSFSPGAVASIDCPMEVGACGYRDNNLTETQQVVSLQHSGINQHVSSWLDAVSDMSMYSHRTASIDANIQLSSVVTLHQTYETSTVPIQMAQCWFPTLAISDTKVVYIFQIKYT